MNGLDGELLVALSEIPLPERLGETSAAHIAVVVAILARNPRYAAAWGLVLTERTAPADLLPGGGRHAYVSGPAPFRCCHVGADGVHCGMRQGDFVHTEPLGAAGPAAAPS